MLRYLPAARMLLRPQVALFSTAASTFQAVGVDRTAKLIRDLSGVPPLGYRPGARAEVFPSFWSNGEPGPVFLAMDDLG
jgi:hypothetical protein